MLKDLRIEGFVIHGEVLLRGVSSSHTHTHTHSQCALPQLSALHSSRPAGCPAGSAMLGDGPPCPAGRSGC